MILCPAIQLVHLDLKESPVSLSQLCGGFVLPNPQTFLAFRTKMFTDRATPRRLFRSAKRKESAALFSINRSAIVTNAAQENEILGFERRDALANHTHEPALPDQRLKYRDFLARMRVIECERLRIRRERLTLFDDLLSEWMTQAIEVGVLDVFPAPIGTGVNLLIGKRVLDERESGFSILERGIGLKIETSQFPQPMVKLAFDFVALVVIDPKFLMNLFIEVFKELLASLLYSLVNLYFHLLL